jgi:crotonobetainyl-CoA:carnitine CoA-transferase CaiB-like acyl-CoA transferase
VQYLKIRRPVDHPNLGTYDIVGQPIHMSAYPQPERLRPTPDQGQHTDEVLRELGYAAAAIAELHQKRVV